MRLIQLWTYTAVLIASFYGVCSRATDLHSAHSDGITAEQVRELETWLVAGGGDLSNVRIGNDAEAFTKLNIENGRRSVERRGLFVKSKAVKKGEVVMTVPIRMGLTIESLLASASSAKMLPLVQSLVAAGATTDTRAFLALHLLWEKHNLHSRSTASPSAWEPLLRSLPAQPSSVCFFDEAELAALQIPANLGASPLENERRDHLIAMANSFSRFREELSKHPGLFPDGTFTELDWEWAFGSMMNNAIVLNGNETVAFTDAQGNAHAPRQKLTLAVLPVVTFANYANPPIANVELRPVVSAKLREARERRRAQAKAAKAAAAAAAAAASAGKGSGIAAADGAARATPAEDVARAASEKELDMVEMEDEALSKVGFDDSYEVQMVALTDLEPGQELLLTYSGGPMTNTQLLVHYGFALHANEYEGVALDLGLLRSDPLYAHKQHIIEKNSLETNTVIRLNGTVSSSFIHALRVKELTQDDIKHLQLFSFHFDPANGFFSLQNELKVNIQLISSIEGLLQQYPTNLQTDRETLLSEYDALSRARRSALAYRIAIKRVLHVITLMRFDRLDNVFANLTNRWVEDVESKIVPAAAAGSGEAEGEAKDTQTGKPEQSGRHKPQEPPLSEEETKQARVELEKYREDLVTWRSEVKQWRAEWTQWVQDASAGVISV